MRATLFGTSRSLVTDCCRRPEVQTRVLLAVFRSLQRSNWYFASWELRTRRELPTPFKQAAVLQAACGLLRTAISFDQRLDGVRGHCGHILRLQGQLVDSSG
jgi:hypothetical protein